MFDLFVTKDAQFQIQEAYDYYLNEVNENVANNFLFEIENVYHYLEINPFFKIWKKNYRAIPLKKYPYIIFFELDEEKRQVKVIAAFNTNRNPNSFKV